MRELLLAAALVAAGVPGAHAAGDAGRGARVHERCLGCHGTELYAPGRAKVRSLAALKREVERWNAGYNPKLTAQEIDDLVAYLNRDFYRFAP
ncbi:MAG: hypothetical protein JNM90_09025 [Burkholderiales bacterium]|nr:hypothetical protein [Burkholderiales bacterium]